MFLSKILKHYSINNYQTSSINQIISKINILMLIKQKKAVKNLNIILIIWFLQKTNLLNFYTCSKLYSSVKKKPHLTSFTCNDGKPQNIRYIIHVNLTYTNTFVNITDVKGNIKLSYSSGAAKLKSFERIKRPTALLTLLKQLSNKLKFLETSTSALHFKNTSKGFSVFILKMLKKKFFIKTIKTCNLRPHNGCRPRKLKRIKRKKIRFS